MGAALVVVGSSQRHGIIHIISHLTRTEMASSSFPFILQTKALLSPFHEDPRALTASSSLYIASPSGESSLRFSISRRKPN